MTEEGGEMLVQINCFDFRTGRGEKQTGRRIKELQDGNQKGINFGFGLDAV